MVWVKGRRARIWWTVLCLAMAWSLHGCAPGRTGGTDAFAATDSLDVFEDVLSNAGPAISEEQLEVLSEKIRSSQPRPDGKDGASTTGNRAYARIEGLTGHRQVVDAKAGLRGLFYAGFRSSSGFSNGYLEVRGNGPLKRIVVGGVRPRLGEGLLLGARYSLFSPPRMARPDGGLAVSPTASVWARQRGVAGTVTAGRNDVSLAGWRETDGETVQADVLWASVSRRYAAGIAGAAAGYRLAPKNGAETAAGGPVDVVVFAGADTPSGMVSGELARFRGRVYGAARSTVRAGGDWNVELFNGPVPGGFSSSVICPADLGRQQWGSAVHRVKRYGGVYTRVSVYSNGQRSETKRKRRNRIELSGRGGEWEASVRLAEETTLTHSTQPVEHRCGPAVRRQGRFRLTWDGGEKIGLRQIYRLQLLTGPGGDGAMGVVGSVGLGYSAGGLEARFQVNNYSLAPGQMGYVTRPGVAGYETVSVVTGTGSDLSSRIRLAAAGRGGLSLYWGQPWRKEPRWYVGLKITL